MVCLRNANRRALKRTSFILLFYMYQGRLFSVIYIRVCIDHFFFFGFSLFIMLFKPSQLSGSSVTLKALTERNQMKTEVLRKHIIRPQHVEM